MKSRVHPKYKTKHRITNWSQYDKALVKRGDIIAQVLTDGNVDDAKTGIELIEQVEDGIKRVIGDTAYDTAAIYDAACAIGSVVVVPPVRRAVVSRSKLPLSARDTTVLKVNAMERREWKKVWLSSARSRREHLLSLQADLGRQAECTALSGAASGGRTGLQNLEHDGGGRHAEVSCYSCLSYSG